MEELVKAYVAYSEQQEKQLKESQKSYDFSRLITSLVLRHPQGLQLEGDQLIISLVLHALVSRQENEELIEERFQSLSKFELDCLFKKSYLVFSGLGEVKDPFREKSSLTYQTTAPGYVLGQLPWEQALEVLTACVKVNSYEQGNYEIELPVLLLLVEAVKAGQPVYPALLFELAQYGALSLQERKAEERRQLTVVQARLLEDKEVLSQLGGAPRQLRSTELRNYIHSLRSLAPRLEYYELRRAVDQFIATLKNNP